MIKTKVAFLEGRHLFSQSELSKKFSKSSDWLEKCRLSKKATEKRLAEKNQASYAGFAQSCR